MNPKAKILIAPAMNGKMWLHPATQQSVIGSRTPVFYDWIMIIGPK